MTHDTLLACPFRVSISQCLFPESLHSLMLLSSAPLATILIVGWKVTQFTPLSCPSRMCFTSTSVPPKSSPGLLPDFYILFSFNLEKSQILIVWSNEADASNVSSGWKVQLIT